jgi:hypothetical protein
MFWATIFNYLATTSWISGLNHRDLCAQIPEMQALLKNILFLLSAKGKNSLSLCWPVHRWFSNPNPHLYFTNPWILLKSL